MWQVLAAIAKKKIDQRMAEHDEMKTEGMNAPQAGGEVELNRQDRPIGAKTIIGAIAGGMAGGGGGEGAGAAAGAAAESGAASGAASEMAQAGSNISVQQAYTPAEGAGGLQQATVPSSIPEAGASQVDVFGGQEYGGMADATAKKAEPHIADYLKNAMQNYARNKIGKRIAGKFDAGADLANAFGEDNKTEAGSKIQDVADWFAGSDRKKREDARRKSGLYAY